MSRTVVFFVLLVAFIGVVASQYVAYGEWLMLAILVFLGLMIILWRPKAQDGDSTKPINIWRRILAFCIDFNIVLISFMGVVLLIASLETWSFTGNLPTLNELEELSESNLLSAVQILGGYLVLVGYYWAHKKMQRSTMGHYLFGYKVINSSDASVKPRYLVGVFAGFFALCSFHVWVWFVPDADTFNGEYWWDRMGGTRAVAIF